MATSGSHFSDTAVLRGLDAGHGAARGLAERLEMAPSGVRQLAPLERMGLVDQNRAWRGKLVVLTGQARVLEEAQPTRRRRRPAAR